MSLSEPIAVPAEIIQQMTSIGVVSILQALAPDGASVWLTGGAIRDAFFGRQPCDFDFTTSVTPSTLAQCFAAEFSGSCFLLDDERLQYRVVWSVNGRQMTADFAPLRGSDISADLRDRDFTLNAMAWELTSGSDLLLDPLQGLAALQAAELKMCTQGAFENDPVRALRGVRLAATHGLQIESATFEQMRISGQYLKYSPGERLRDELIKLFATECADALNQIRLLGIEKLVFDIDNDLKCWNQRISAVRDCEEHSKRWSVDVFPLLNNMATTSLRDEIVRQTFIKLCCFYRPGKPSHDSWFAERLRLSRRNSDLIGRMADFDSAHYETFSQVADSARARALWCASLDSDPPSALLLMALLADSKDVLDQLERVARDWLAHDRNGRISALLSGDEIQALLTDIDGPQTGVALRLLQEAEIAGVVCDAASAAEYLIRNREKVFDNNLSGSL